MTNSLFKGFRKRSGGIKDIYVGDSRVVYMIRIDDRIMLWNTDEKILLIADGEVRRIPGLGVVDTGKLVGDEWGDEVSFGSKSYRMLQLSLEHAPDLIKRGPQIIQPYMGSLIVHNCDISCGHRVIEGGAGSGMMSAVLCSAVGSAGKVSTYELRDDHLRLAKSNISLLGLTDNWDPIKGDVTKDVEERDVDAFVVDIPEPWGALEMAYTALKNGGSFASYIPSMNQMERVHVAMRKNGFADVRAFENIRREMVVGEGVTRPSFEMLGHTGYVVVGRKVVR